MATKKKTYRLPVTGYYVIHKPNTLDFTQCSLSATYDNDLYTCAYSPLQAALQFERRIARDTAQQERYIYVPTHDIEEVEK